MRVTCWTRFLREKFILERAKNHLFRIMNQLAHFEWGKQLDSAEFLRYFHIELNSLTKMVSGFILFSCQSQYFVIFCISSCSPWRAFLVMQRCQVLQLDSVEWNLDCLLSFFLKINSGNWFYKKQSNFLSLFVLWENFQSDSRLTSIMENTFLRVETNVTLNIIFLKSV